MVKNGKCRVFTLISGSILRILLDHGVSLEELCLTEEDRIWNSKLPKSKHHDMEWVLAFGEFVDEFVMPNVLVQQYVILFASLIYSLTASRRSDVLYAFGLTVGHLQYNTVDESAILVTVFNDLRIVISACPTGPAIYVDVPFENIQHTTIVSEWNAESQEHRHAVTIELSRAVKNAWYYNAAGRKGGTLSMAFTSPYHAKTLSAILQQREKAGKTGRPTVMESQPINCSEPALDGEFATPNLALTESQSLAGVALEANSLLSQNPPIGAFHPKNPALPSTSQSGITKHVSGSGLEADIYHDTQRPASSVSSAIEGIDVSQPDPVNSRKNDSNTRTSAAHAGGQAIETPRPAGTLAGVELEESPGQTAAGSPSKDQSSNYQDLGYDSSYDISPRASRVRPKSKDNAVPMIQPKLSRPTSSKRTLTAIDDGPTEKPPPSKLSKSLRNKDGNVEAGILSPSSLELARAVGNLPKTLKASKTNDKDGVPSSAKSKVGLQKSHLIKKTKEAKGKGQAPKGKDQEHIEDEYDLPRSPKSPVRKLEAPMIQGKAISQASDGAIQQKPKPRTSAKAAILPSSLPSQHLKVSSKPTHAPKSLPQKADQPAKSEVTKDAGNESIWDIGLENSGEDDEASPKQKTRAKRVAKKPARRSEEGKSKKDETKSKKIASRASTEYTTRAKLAHDLTEPRSRRAAALIAKEKIHNLEESDEIVDEVEESVSMSEKKPKKTTNKQEVQPSLTKIPEGKSLKDTDKGQASISDKATNYTLSYKDTAPSIGAAECADSEASSLENVELVSTTTRHGTAQVGTTSRTGLPPNSELSVAHGTSSNGGEGRGAISRNTDGDIYHESRNLETGFIPESIIEDLHARSKEERSVIERNPKTYEEVRPLKMVGDAEDSHFQEAMADMEFIDRQENEGGKTATSQTEEGHSHMTRKEVQSTERATQPKSSKAVSGVSKARDHFEARLSLLAPINDGPASTVKRHARPHTEHTSEASKAYNGGEYRVNEGKDLRNARKVNDSGRVTRSGMEAGIVQQQDNISLSAKSGLHKEAQAQQQRQKNRRPMTQSVQAEQQQKVGLTPPKQAVSKPITPTLSVAAVGNKRQVVPDGGAREKRPKLTPFNGDKAPLKGKDATPQRITRSATSTSAKGKPMKTAETQPPDINRKPEIISFSAGGPRNQGRASIKKLKPLNISTGVQTDDSNQIVPEREREVLKRKAASRVDRPADEQPTKRQNRDITPPTKHEHVPQMVPEPTNSIAVHEKPIRVSLQSTRVAENGSPMPFTHAHDDRDAQAQGYMEETIVDPYLRTDLDTEDEQCVSYAQGDDLEDNTGLPLTKIPPPPQGHNAGFDRFSSNSKRKCVSPNAPSDFTSIPAHYVFHDGTLVNSQTRENIVPSEPQDPFMGAGQVETSDILRALRNRSGTEARGQNDLISGKRMAINAKRQIPTCTEDPDKTLVEVEPPRKRRKHDVISVGSTITSSSSGLAASEGISSSVEASSQESDVDTIDPWQMTIEPHQDLILDVLSNISLVSNVNASKNSRH